MRTVFPLIIAVLSCSLCSTAQGGPIPTEPILTNKTRFRIPYRYDSEEIKRLGAKEIRLFLSVDYGGSWRHILSVTPDTGHFEFEATQDGEYWFAVRTLDGQDQLYPKTEVMDAGLKVIVDTSAPVFNLDLRQLDPGKVSLSWDASDAQLDVTTLRLEYMQPGLSDWQLVAVAPQPSGQTSWSLSEGGVVAVRGSIGDRANNISRSQTQVHVESAAQSVPRPNVPDFSQPIASAPQRPSPVIAPDPRDSFISNPSRSFGNTHSADLSSVTRNPTPTFASQQKATKPRPQSRLRRLVNSTRFQIDYRIDEVGPSGLSRVELFVTQNDGQKWWKYGDDSDMQSPFPVEVPGDGIYGFLLRVHSGVGLAEEPPRPGEKPTIVIGVDQTPPVLQLMPVRQGKGAELNKLMIEWQMADDNPADEPVALYYSSNPNGPWEPVSGWQANTGSYLWSVGTGVPSRIFIQVIARDAAGNVSRAETKQPILVDLTKPSARIVDVESLAPASRY